mmetsp:Transcript_65077/g.105218  ORF Transcript_65077/g.105218 Transcript_65077/m.105218 type:complete len:304 (-) Transcript_65077:75-986(-)
MERYPVDAILVALKHVDGLALVQRPKVDPAICAGRGQSDSVALERCSALDTGMPSNAVAPVFMTTDRESWRTRRHTPELDEARPGGCAEEPAIRRELPLGQRPIVSHLRHLCNHGLLEEGAETVDALLVLLRVLLCAISALLHQSLVGPRDGPLRDLHTRLQQLLDTLGVEEVLIPSSCILPSILGRSSSPCHDGSQTVASLIRTFTEDADWLAELPELRLDLGVACGNGHLSLGCLGLEGFHGVLVLLPRTQHVLCGTIDDIGSSHRGQVNVVASEHFAFFACLAQGAGEVAIVDVCLLPHF